MHLQFHPARRRIVRIMKREREMRPHLPYVWGGTAFVALACALGQTPIQAYSGSLALIPCEVRIATAAPDTATAAGARAEEKKRQQDQLKTPRTKLRAHFTSAEDKKRETDESKAGAEAKAERLRLSHQYISSSMSLERVRVEAGENPRTSTGSVFGSVVNEGTRTIRKVTVRIYFLDGSGQRIGEMKCFPVLVTDVSKGGERLLRPGHRGDFGCTVKGNAPPGWAKRVQAEIVDIEFSDE